MDKPFKIVDGIEKLLYGMRVKNLAYPTKIKSCIFYINHKNAKIIDYVVPGVKRIDQINMVDITSINFGKNNGNFVEKPENKDVKKIDEDRCLTIRLSKDFIDLIFESSDDLTNFCAGVLAFFTGHYLDKVNDNE